LNSIVPPFKNLENDVYGHCHRSQNTLRLARQNLFTSAQNFPYYKLTEETRTSLISLLNELITNIIDPTITYIQKNSMDKFYTFSGDSGSTVVEQTFDAAFTQVTSMTAECKTKVTARSLMQEYGPYLNLINACTRSVSQYFRPPINLFTRRHFQALPKIGDVTRDLNQCSNSNNNRIEPCSVDFMKKYCQDESCKVNQIM
jgi:hypothetical protein